MGFGGPAGQDGGGTKKSNKKAIADTEVSAYEKEIAKQKAEKKAEANVEIGLGTPSKNVIDGTLSDPREKDDTAAKQSIKDSKKKKTTIIGDGGNDGGNNNIPAPTIIKKTAGGQTVQVTAPTEAELSQSAAADADADDIYIRKKKSKARGRSMMTLTTPQGVKDDKLTLGKPSLLGS